MAGQKQHVLSNNEIAILLDEDNDNLSDLEVDDDDEKEEDTTEVTEIIFNSAGEVIEEINCRYSTLFRLLF
jgi:hypothetical protein